MERSSKQNINKDIVALNKALEEMDLTALYTACHPKEAKYTFFFKCKCNIFKDRPHDRTQNKPQQIQENSNHIKHFLDHKGLKLETNLKEKKPQTLKNMEIE